MEQAFGRDFGHVRAHTGTDAQEASRELGARAFTLGADIAFDTPNPDKGTIAHELAHVVQQKTSPGVQTSGATSRDDPAEREARIVEQAFASGQDIPPITQSLSPSSVAGDWDNPDWSLEYRESDRAIIARPRRTEGEPARPPTIRDIIRGLRLPGDCLTREILASGNVVFRIRDRFFQGDVLHPRIRYALVREGLMPSVVEWEREVPEATPGQYPTEYLEQVERLAGSRRTFQYNELMTYLSHEGRAAHLQSLYSNLENQPSAMLIEWARRLDEMLTVRNENAFRLGGAFYLRELGRILLQIYDIIDQRLQTQLLSPRTSQAEEGPLARLTSRRVEVEGESPLGYIAMDIVPFNNHDLWTSYANVRIIPPPTWRFGRRPPPPPPPPPPRPRPSRPACNIEIPKADIISETDEHGIGRRYRLGERKFRVLFDFLRAAIQSGFDDRYIIREQVLLRGTFLQLLYEHRMHTQGSSSLPSRVYQTIRPGTFKGSVSALFEQLAPEYFDETLEVRISTLLNPETRSRVQSIVGRHLGRIPRRQWRLFGNSDNVRTLTSGNDYKLDFSDEILSSYRALAEYGLDTRSRVSAITIPLNGALQNLDGLFQREAFAQLSPDQQRFFRTRARLLMANPAFEIIRLQGSGGTTLGNVVQRLFRYYASRLKQGRWRDFGRITVTNENIVVPCAGGVRSLIRVIDNTRNALEQYKSALEHIEQQSVLRFRAREGVDYLLLRRFFNSRLNNHSALDYWAREWSEATR